MNKEVKWLFSLLKPFTAWIILGGFFAGITIIGNMGLLATSAVLLSQAALMPPLLWLMPMITGVRFFGISRAVLRYAERLLNHSIAYRILGRLRVRLYRKLEELVPDKLIGYTEGMLYQSLLGDIDVLQYFYLRAVSLPLAFFIVLGSAGFFLSFYSLGSSLVLFFAMLLAGILLPILVRLGSRGARNERDAAKAHISEDFLDYQHGLTDLMMQSSALEAWQKRLKRRFSQIAKADVQSGKWEAFGDQGIIFISHLSLLAVLIVAVPLVRSGELKGIYLALVGMVLLGAFEAVQAMPQAVVQMSDSLKSAKRLKAVEDIETLVFVPEDKDLLDFSVYLDKVDFHYHDPKRHFIQDVTLGIPQGSHVVLLGESGSGKTSLAKLIAGLWTPDQGQVFLGSIPYKELNREQIYRNIGYVQQNASIFHASVRENLYLANAEASEEDLWAALDAVDLKEIVAGMPEGLDTSLGEEGNRLSGGQRQRLAIARLFLQDPKIAILDEPTQNLDKHHATRIMKAIMAWGKNRTLVIITHQMTDLVYADFIFYMRHGKLIEQGNYNELMKKKAWVYDAVTLSHQQI